MSWCWRGDDCRFKSFVTEKLEDGQELVYAVCKFDKRPCGFKWVKKPCVKTETEGDE